MKPPIGEMPQTQRDQDPTVNAEFSVEENMDRLAALLGDETNPVSVDEFLGLIIAQERGDILKGSGDDAVDIVYVKDVNGKDVVSSDSLLENIKIGTRNITHEGIKASSYVTSSAGIRGFVLAHRDEISGKSNEDFPQVNEVLRGILVVNNREQLSGYLIGREGRGVPKHLSEPGVTVTTEEVSNNIQAYIERINGMTVDDRSRQLSNSANIYIPGVPMSLATSVRQILRVENDSNPNQQIADFIEKLDEEGENQDLIDFVPGVTDVGNAEALAPETEQVTSPEAIAEAEKRLLEIEGELKNNPKLQNYVRLQLRYRRVDNEMKGIYARDMEDSTKNIQLAPLKKQAGDAFMDMHKTPKDIQDLYNNLHDERQKLNEELKKARETA